MTFSLWKEWRHYNCFCFEVVTTLFLFEISCFPELWTVRGLCINVWRITVLYTTDRSWAVKTAGDRASSSVLYAIKQPMSIDTLFIPVDCILLYTNVHPAWSVITSEYCARYRYIKLLYSFNWTTRICDVQVVKIWSLILPQFFFLPERYLCSEHFPISFIASIGVA